MTNSSSALPLDPIGLLADLVAIDSVNPDLVPGAPGEAEIADFCESWLSDHGLETHRLETRAGRPSVVGIAHGHGGGRSLMLNGHYDTVSLAGYDGDPLDPVQRDGKLFGRVAFDMKGGVAAAMVAVARAATLDLRGEVMVACVADEEHSSFGTEEVLARFTADAAIVTEPSHLAITLWHKGFIWFEVTIIGRAAHGSRPDLGVDAIAKAGHVLVALEERGERLRTGPRHPELGSGTVHASLIHGGEEASSYPASCHITVERRTVPGESADLVEAQLVALLETLVATIPGFTYRLERGLVREPFEADPQSDIVRIVSKHARTVTGNPPLLRGNPSGPTAR
ncbi:MAG: M20/M25/M40 family metallo-hydrolase [Thermomicrobiales bacterium]